jgi:hypothetical protein
MSPSLLNGKGIMQWQNFDSVRVEADYDCVSVDDITVLHPINLASSSVIY